MDIVTVPGFVKFHHCFLQLDSSKIFIVHYMLQVLRFCNQFFGFLFVSNETNISMFTNILTGFA